MAKKNKDNIEEVVIHTDLLDQDVSHGELIDIIHAAFKYAELEELLSINSIDTIEVDNLSSYEKPMDKDI
tara:strand:- start:1101 stop:1310 length:210 start_codon:yes stop_codon:yes gene_type:complete